MLSRCAGCNSQRVTQCNPMQNLSVTHRSRGCRAAAGQAPEYGTLLWAMRTVMQLCQSRVLRQSEWKKAFLQSAVWLISASASRIQVLF